MKTALVVVAVLITLFGLYEAVGALLIPYVLGLLFGWPFVTP